MKITNKSVFIWKIGITLLLIVGGAYIAHKTLQKEYPIYNFFFEPADFDYEVFIGESDMKEERLIGRIKINCKYPGNYWIVGYTEKQEDMGYKYKSKLVFEEKLYKENKLIKTFISKELKGFWIGNTIVQRFYLPKDWHLHEEVTLQVNLIKADPEFHKKYGKLKLFFVKGSDE